MPLAQQPKDIDDYEPKDDEVKILRPRSQRTQNDKFALTYYEKTQKKQHYLNLSCNKNWCLEELTMRRYSAMAYGRRFRNAYNKQIRPFSCSALGLLSGLLVVIINKSNILTYGCRYRRRLKVEM